MPHKAPAAADVALQQEVQPSAFSQASAPTSKRMQVGMLFNIDETRELLCIIANVKPIGGQGWNEVELQFNKKSVAGMPSFKV